MYKKIIYWYLSREAMPYWCVLLTDCAVVFFSGMLAYAINHGLAYSVSEFGMLCRVLSMYLLCFLIGFRLFHTYSLIIHDFSFADQVRLGLSLFTGAMFILLMRMFLYTDSLLLTIRLRDLLLQMLFALVLMCGLRVTLRIFYDFYRKLYTPGGAYGLSDDKLLRMEMKELLPREPISVDMDDIYRKMCGRRIMVTGAAGSIGSEIVRQLAACRPKELVLIDQAETPLHDIRMMMKREWPEVKCSTIVTNICHSHRMERIFYSFCPEIIFHAAAYKHVPMMEDNVVESILNNVDGTRKLADLAVRYGVRQFVMVSTDKAVNPTNVMGCSKRICEIYCQSLSKVEEQKENGCQFITTRFGNVLDSNGSVIPIFREQIRRGGPVEVTHPDIIRYFMLIPEACLLVLKAATIGNGGEIFVFDMGQPVRIADLARRMIELSGRKDIHIKYVGLRPGEKLYEEVLNEEESVLPTRHEKIKIARVREYSFADIQHQIERLIVTARTYDTLGTLAIMRQIVPEYKSSGNEYTDEESRHTILDSSSYLNINN